MTNPPQYPSVPTDLDKRDKTEQQRIISAAYIEGASVYTTIVQRFWVLVNYIETETCHGE